MLAPCAGMAASVNDWRADIDQIAADIRLRHPDPFAKIGPLAFDRARRELKQKLPEMNEEERLAGAMRLVAMIGDGHTQLEPDSHRFDSWYPLRFYEFEDGYFIVGAHRSVKDLAGAQIIDIGGRPVAEAATMARDLMGADNAFDRKERLYALSNAALMKGLGLAENNGALSLKLKLRNGRTATRKITASKSSEEAPTKGATFEWRFFPEMKGPPIGVYSDWFGVFGETYADYRTIDYSRPAHLFYRRAYVSKAMPERDAHYLQVNIVADSDAEPQPTLRALFASALEEMRAYKPKRFIVDLRYNFGGDGSRIPGVIHEFIKREDDLPYDDLYIVTGRRTFSAAIMALEGFTKHTRYSIVGEPSGAALNHYGDAELIKYERTGLQLYVSTLSHQLNEYDPGEFVYVDAPALMRFADYVAGRDPAIDTILGGGEMRSIANIALANGGAAARKALADRVAASSGYDWWSPPPFEDLKRVGYDLLEDFDRPTDAAEIFTSLTELYPDSWNAWESLGRAQVAMGDADAARRSYKCSLAIDPDTFEDGDLRALIAQSGSELEMPAGCPVRE